MPTIDGTLISQQLAEATANVTEATAQKRAMASDIIDRGASGITTDSTIAAIGASTVELVDSLRRGELTTVLTFHVNPPGAGGYIPADPDILGQALAGAHVLVEQVDSPNVWRIPITSLENFRATMENTFTQPVTRLLVSVVCGSGSEDIRSTKQMVVVGNSATVTVTLVTYLSEESATEVGRVFPVDPADKTSYLITASTARGKRTETFGYFDAAGVWISATGINASVPEIDPETGAVASWANGPDGAADFETLWPWSAVRRETFTVTDAAGLEVPMEMAGLRRADFYGVRIEHREAMPFVTVGADGSKTTVTRPVRILWIARPTIPGYHIPSCFYRKAWESTEAGGKACRMELSAGLFLGAHKGNLQTVTLPLPSGGTERKYILNSGTVGSTNSGSSVAEFVSHAANLNRLRTLDPTTGVTLEPDATGRRWAAMNLDSYMAFWPLFVVQFGMDAQAVFQGVTQESGTPQTKAGTTDAVIRAGYMTGSVGPAAGLTPFCFLGVENFGYGSEGDTLADVCFYSGKDKEEDAFTTKTMLQPDRAAYTPNVADMATAAAAGYQLLTVRNGSNDITHFSGMHEDPALRDIHAPTLADDGFLNAKGCDYLGGIYRNGQGVGQWALSNACLFGYRCPGNAGGSRAGVCAVGWYNSGGGPGYSDGAYFGSRVTLLL